MRKGIAVGTCFSGHPFALDPRINRIVVWREVRMKDEHGSHVIGTEALGVEFPNTADGMRKAQSYSLEQTLKALDTAEVIEVPE